MFVALLLLGLVDFSVGVLFGNIGHMYSLLCFPLIALIRGYLGINTDSKNYKNAMFLIVTGAGLFFVGLMLGIIMYAVRFSNDINSSLFSASIIGQALTLSIATGFGYFIVYILFGLLSAYLCRETNHIRHIGKNKEV
jgi:hypothetical protein